MAKKKEPEFQEEGTSKNALVLFEGTDKLIEQSKTVLISETIGTEEILSQLEDDYNNLIVGGIEDMVGYNAVVEGAKKVKAFRTSVEGLRKSLNEPALKWQREINAEAKRITERLTPIEQRLLDEKKRIDDAKAAKARELFLARTKELTENAYQLVNGFYVCGIIQVSAKELETMDEEKFQNYIARGKQEIERQRAEEQRKSDEQERIRKEREAMDAERAELARMKAELEAQKKALEATYEQVTQPEPTPTAPAQAQPTQAEINERNTKASLMSALSGRDYSHARVEQTVQDMTAPATAGPAPSQMKPTLTEYQRGFEDFRRIMLEHFASGVQLNRQGWVDLITKQQPDVVF